MQTLVSMMRVALAMVVLVTVALPAAAQQPISAKRSVQKPAMEISGIDARRDADGYKLRLEVAFPNAVTDLSAVMKRTLNVNKNTDRLYWKGDMSVRTQGTAVKVDSLVRYEKWLITKLAFGKSLKRRLIAVDTDYDVLLSPRVEGSKLSLGQTVRTRSEVSRLVRLPSQPKADMFDPALAGVLQPQLVTVEEAVSSRRGVTFKMLFKIDRLRLENDARSRGTSPYSLLVDLID